MDEVESDNSDALSIPVLERERQKREKETRDAASAPLTSSMKHASIIKPGARVRIVEPETSRAGKRILKQIKEAEEQKRSCTGVSAPTVMVPNPRMPDKSLREQLQEAARGLSTIHNVESEQSVVEEADSKLVTLKNDENGKSLKEELEEASQRNTPC